MPGHAAPRKRANRYAASVHGSGALPSPVRRRRCIDRHSTPAATVPFVVLNRFGQSWNTATGDQKMEQVQQLDGTGCGLACIATLTGESYQMVKQQALSLPLYDGFGNRQGRGCSCWTSAQDLRTLLNVYGLQLGRVVWLNAQMLDQCMRLNEFAEHMKRRANGRNAIVATHRRSPAGILGGGEPTDDDSWHWIVWDGEQCCIHDPRDPPRKRNIRPSFYMYVV